MREGLVWGRFGTMLRWEWAEPRVLEIIYRAVAQALLLFGYDNWVLSTATERKSEGTHTDFLYRSRGNERNG